MQCSVTHFPSYPENSYKSISKPQTNIFIVITFSATEPTKRLDMSFGEPIGTFLLNQ